jgi:hypothetical protein
MAAFKGGKKLEEKLGAIAKAIGKKATLRVGFLEGAKYPDGTPVAMVAAIQEFGAPRARIPPRPYFRTMIREKRSEWAAGLAIQLREAGYDVAKALARMGDAIKGQLQRSIRDVTSPPLSPVTLMLRKWFPSDHSPITGRIVGAAARAVAAGESSEGASTKPLVWTGHLLNSVDSEVKEG